MASPRITNIQKVNDISENRFRTLWQHQQINTGRLFTENGEPIEILYPGRPNDGKGADFRDAVVITGGNRLTGDIELHVRSGDWRNHKHHLNADYNKVILHVVIQNNSGKSTTLQNGKEVPVLTLGKRLKTGDTLNLEPVQGIAGIPCSGLALKQKPDRISGILETAGDRRFEEKVESFQKDFADCGPAEALYRGIMAALGYSGNKIPFLELARRLPVQELESEVRKLVKDEEYILFLQANFLGTAGFLSAGLQARLASAGIDRNRIELLVGIWSSYGRVDTMSPESWQLFRIRPENSPVRRLAAMSFLMCRYRYTSLLGGILEAADAAFTGEDCRGLENALMVNSNEYPGLESDTGNPVQKIALLGRSRAAVMAVNVLLPFIGAVSLAGGISDSVNKYRKALSFYRRYPRLADNSLEKHMSMQLGIGKSAVMAAVHQQGLIYIYNHLCSQGRCGECELGKFKAGDDIEGEVVDFTRFETEIAA